MNVTTGKLRGPWEAVHFRLQIAPRAERKGISADSTDSADNSGAIHPLSSGRPTSMLSRTGPDKPPERAAAAHHHARNQLGPDEEPLHRGSVGAAAHDLGAVAED